MKLQLAIGGKSCEIEIDPAGTPGHWLIRLDSGAVEADACWVRPGVMSLLIDGRSWRIVLDPDDADPALYVGAERVAWRLEDMRSLTRRRRAAGEDGPVTLKASMPGRVVRILLEEGDPVAAYQAVLVIEAMKMQNELKSPKDGRVGNIRVGAGDTVASGDVLLVIE